MTCKITELMFTFIYTHMTHVIHIIVSVVYTLIYCTAVVFDQKVEKWVAVYFKKIEIY